MRLIRQEVYTALQTTSRAVLLTRFTNTPNLEAILSKISTGAIESISCYY
jgi:hypothetical protein